MTLPDDMIAGEDQLIREESIESLVRNREEEDEVVIAEARRGISESQQRRVERANEGVSSSPYTVGDLVRYKLKILMLEVLTEERLLQDTLMCTRLLMSKVAVSHTHWNPHWETRTERRTDISIYSKQ